MVEKFKSPKESFVMISELMLPSHSNFNGKIHGGYILNLMDQIAFACASKHSGYYCVTASVDNVDFLTPIDVGDLVTLRASVDYIGTTSMIVGIRVDSENIKTGEKKHCNSSYFTMVAKSKDNQSVEVPGLILESEIEIKRFVRGMTHRQFKMTYNKEFKTIDFKDQELIDTLKKYRVKIALPSNS